MKKRFSIPSIFWFVAKHALLLLAAYWFSAKLMEKWDVIRLDHALEKKANLLMGIYSGMLLIYAAFFDFSNRRISSLFRLMLVQLIVTLYVLAGPDISSMMLWMVTFIFYSGILYLLGVYYSRLARENDPIIEWLSIFNAKMRVSPKKKSAFCFICSAILWMAYPLTFFRVPDEVIQAPAFLSYLFLCLGVGFELYYALVQSEDKES